MIQHLDNIPQLPFSEYYLIRRPDKYIFCEKQIETKDNENIIYFTRYDITLNKHTSDFIGGYYSMSHFSLPSGDVTRISKIEYDILQGLSISLSDHISYIEDVMINSKCKEANADCAIISFTTTVDVSEFYIKNEENGKWYKIAEVNSEYGNIFLLNPTDGDKQLETFLPIYLDNVQIIYTQVLAYQGSHISSIEECIERGLAVLYKAAEYIFNVNNAH